MQVAVPDAVLVFDLQALHHTWLSWGLAPCMHSKAVIRAGCELKRSLQRLSIELEFLGKVAGLLDLR